MLRVPLMCIWGFVYVAAAAAGIAQFDGRLTPNSQIWIWGPPVRPQASSTGRWLDVWEELPDHGFVHLAHYPGKLSVLNVQRPSNWPQHESFCSSMVAAGIVEFMHSNRIGVENIHMVVVGVEAHPFVAACKCYMRVMIDMGFTNFGPSGRNAKIGQTGVGKFCQRPRGMLIARLPRQGVARLPFTTLADLESLRSADTILTSFR